MKKYQSQYFVVGIYYDRPRIKIGFYNSLEYKSISLFLSCQIF